MNERRTRQLIERELDGEISSLERDELARGLVGSPGARRRRGAWREIAEAIGEPAPERPSLLLPRLEQGVTSTLRRPRRPARGSIRVGRWALVGAATAAIAGAALLAQRGAAPREPAGVPAPVRVAFEPPAPAHARRSAPVSIDVSVAGEEADGDADPTTVTF